MASAALIVSSTLTFWRARCRTAVSHARLWTAAAGAAVDRAATARGYVLGVGSRLLFGPCACPVAERAPNVLSLRPPSVYFWTDSALLRASKESSSSFAASRSTEGADRNAKPDAVAGQQGQLPSQASGDGPDKDSRDNGEVQESSKKLSLFQRFKNAYKEYGKVLIAVHIATSAVWFGSFYYIARSGVDIAPMLQTIGVSDSIISKVTDSAAGDVAVAYVIYEITKPLRFAVTLVGTQHTVRKLRQWGYMELRKDEDRLTVLAREGRQQLKDKRAAIAEKVRQRVAGRLVFRRRAGRAGRSASSYTMGKEATPAGSPSPNGGAAAASKPSQESAESVTNLSRSSPDRPTIADDGAKGKRSS